MQFGSFTYADIADGRGDQHAFGAFQRTEHDLNRKLAAVVSPPDKFDAGADLLCQRLGRGAGAIRDQPLGEAMRYDVCYPLSDQFVATISELRLGLEVDQ